MFFPNFYHESYIRVLHASPGAPPVDVYANNTKIASNLKFKNLTNYIRVRPGNYNIKVYKTGETTNPLLRKDVNITPNSTATIAAINRPKNLDLQVISDPVIQNMSSDNTAFIRVAHLSPDAPGVDVRPDRQRVFKNARYKDITGYKDVDPGTYNINIYKAWTDDLVLSKSNMVFQSGFYYTIYILGLVEGKPPLQIIVPLDGVY